MQQVSVREAETQLSRLIEQASHGDDILIVEGGVPIARLSAIRSSRVGRRFGTMAGRARVDEGFFEPLPEDELSAWEG
ncbi:type II toxin-antitoxin system Phd/YefM family antitoxin [Thiocapsa bogorovii]|uniref:type II toxin-antitoxin system Phd/YefM family antitoxin n=1 Tax=Thiocapsa bogorovii TaxID=521689 RepID=UPI001E342D57|nr:type II toxin-antitoxin system prevent-host-death family antitoxin [Thiocapsa bogorovii]UHD17834.1 type II toxin-antitoxin system prevent-host-death family antitoxin [Thiocapsa bogorovii]